MKISRSNPLSLALVVLSFVMAAAMYDKLPELSPTRFTPKPWGPFVLPLEMGYSCSSSPSRESRRAAIAWSASKKSSRSHRWRSWPSYS
jgi:hypothetical protein